MSLGFYKLIKGRLIVRERQSPDGDSMRFIADDMSLFETLPRYTEPKGSDGLASYQLRFQAIDTPELHYGSAAQPCGVQCRDGLLRWLGVNPEAWNWEVAPAGFEWETPAEILTDGFEAHSRPVAFVLRETGLPDGSEIKLTNDLLMSSYNHHAVETGLAYLGLYSGGLSAEIKSHLIATYKNARADKRGIWEADGTSQFTISTLDDLLPENGTLIYPKIFRRCVDALKWAGGELKPGSDLDDFLMAKTNENDSFYVEDAHGGRLKSQLSNVLEQVNNQIIIQVDLNTVEFVPK
ncbi:hypothetical protein [Pseudomonas fluorescens]|uniref:hypothetical protein n=1 Tax=Pseudomonas fluorescens TaxID=294 RepID=UPI003D04C4D0